MNSWVIWKYNFAGWVLFVVSALFFMWSSLRAGDIIAFIASVLFFIACIVFMIPAWKVRHELMSEHSSPR